MKERIKDFLKDDFDSWELWLYCVVLPVGFIMAALIGSSF